MESLPEINVGVLGHIDHGKTTLLSRLTGKFADTHSEEIKRGITIKLGYADTIIYKDKDNYNIDKKGKPIRYVSFIDSPGHEMLIMTMISSTVIIDAAILVIAANEGIRQQTKEHFMVLESKKIKNLIVVQNKIDLVTKEQALKNYKQIKDFLKGSLYEDSVIIPVSAQQGINIDKVLEELCKIEIPKRDLDSEPVFLTARSFDINHPGSSIENLKGGVLGGVLKKGVLRVGDKIEIKPGLKINEKGEYQTIETKIKSLHKGNDSVNEITPGASVSIETELDPYMTRADSLIGQVVSKQGLLPEISWELKFNVNFFEESYEKLKSNEKIMLNINTMVVVGIVKKIKDNQVEAGLSSPIIKFKGDDIGIMRIINGHWKLIGFGKIIE